MSPAKIFLVGDDENKLNEMVEATFDKEDILQQLLANYPDLLPGDQINAEDPRRWLLVSREMGVPGEADGGNIWSLDHLFLDQDGIPTFVECKRSSDTRSRREVVAQMLDYAANGTSYWQTNTLRQAAQETAKAQNKDWLDELQRVVGGDDPVDVDEFWKKVETNLRIGKVRLLFVTDSISRELRRLIEFLNEKMNDVEVLGVEIKQYVGKGKHKAVVPRVIGATETARDAKATASGKSPIINREIFLSHCQDAESLQFYSYVLDSASPKGLTIVWGVTGFSVGWIEPETRQRIPFLLCYPERFELTLGYLIRAGANDQAIRKEMAQFKTLTAAGKFTLRSAVKAANSAELRQVVEYIFGNVERWIRKSAGSVH